MLDKKIQQVTTVTFEPEENSVYAYQNGRLTKLAAPESGFGKQELVWQDNQIVQNNVYFTQRIK